MEPPSPPKKRFVVAAVFALGAPDVERHSADEVEIESAHVVAVVLPRNSAKEDRFSKPAVDQLPLALRDPLQPGLFNPVMLRKIKVFERKMKRHRTLRQRRSLEAK